MSIVLLGCWFTSGKDAWAFEKSLIHDAYVWQRAWTEPVSNGVTTVGTNFSELIVLRAEVTWKSGQPQVAHVLLDYEALRRSGRPIGLALRIGPFSGPFAGEDARTRWLADLAEKLTREATTNGVALAEFQLDFDCAESKLDGYSLWVTAIRQRISPLPLTLTALPTWFRQSACRRLMEAADGFVLQVHSLERPKDFTASFTLCDPSAAQAAVERAARFGRPFKVALPTYGYLVAFDEGGRFAGISAEGPAPSWQAGWQVREVRADAVELAELIRHWENQRPTELTGIIWYRLPVATDRLNWRWPTLSKVMAGEMPQPEIRIEIQSPKPNLYEVDWCNIGTGEYVGPLKTMITWDEGRLVAGDGQQGCELNEVGARQVELKSASQKVRVTPGERWRMGWLRLENGRNVRVQPME